MESSLSGASYWGIRWFQSVSNVALLHIVVCFRFLLAHSLQNNVIKRSKDMSFNCSFLILFCPFDNWPSVETIAEELYDADPISSPLI